MQYKYQKVVSFLNYFYKIPESGSKVYHICGIGSIFNLVLMKKPRKSGVN